jgi:tight adherence protein B
MIGSITTLIFFAVLAALTCAGLLLQAQKMRSREALRRRLGTLAQSTVDPLLLAEEAEANGLRQLLIESGLGWDLSMFVTRTALFATCGLLFGAALGSVSIGVIFAVLGGGAVLFFVRGARARRLKKCDEQMPQALEIMALALRAGHALPSALRLAADEAPAPINHELRRASDEHALGLPLPEVLEAMSTRLPGCVAVNTFVVAVLVLQETGGNLITVIDRIVENARARAGYNARLRALTAEGRTSAKLLAMLPPAFALMAAAADPGYSHFLFHDVSGQTLLGVAIAWWTLGVFFTRRLVRKSMA